MPCVRWWSIGGEVDPCVDSTLETLSWQKSAQISDMYLREMYLRGVSALCVLFSRGVWYRLENIAHSLDVDEIFVVVFVVTE